MNQIGGMQALYTTLILSYTLKNVSMVQLRGGEEE